MLILASASPRRRELLAWLGLHFAVDPADVDESPRGGEVPAALVRRLAHSKAHAVSIRRPDDWVLGADTVVVIDGKALGKPADPAEARAMLSTLSGREHRVFTGFALLCPGGEIATVEAVITTVTFHPLRPAAIDAYVATGEADDKAGGYAIQGAGAAMIAGIDGSLTNVIGLPLTEVGRALAEAGLIVGV